MSTQLLEDDLNELLDDHGFTNAVLIIPSDVGEMRVLVLNISEDSLRQIAHAILAELKDTRKLN